MLIVIAGNPVDGFNYFGPFDDNESAEEWAESNISDSWWITEIKEPK